MLNEVSLSHTYQPYAVHIRPLVRFSTLQLEELDSDECKKYGISMKSSNPSICEVRDDNVLIPISQGDTEIIVESESGAGYKVAVHVS